MLSAGVVADANVLLSAAVGKAASRVFHFDLAIHTTLFNAEEVARYLPRLAEKYGLPAPLVELQWKLLPVQIHGPESYAALIEDARRRLATRDPEDAHPWALAGALGMALWSNDHDLVGHGIEVYTTARLLRELESSSAAPGASRSF